MSERWRNWARCASAYPQHIATPKDESALSDVITAAACAGRSIRPVGSGHSFTPIAATDGVLLRTDHFTGIRHVDHATGEVTLGAGTRLGDIPKLLAPHHLAMENLGDIDRQTLAGAISTGTHGTGLGFTGLAGQVTGVRIMLADGSAVDADASHHPELFAAGRLGLGAFGVLTEVRVKCVPEFLLLAQEHPEPIDELLDDFPARAAAVDHLEFYLFPHTEIAAVKENTRLPHTAARHPRSKARAFVDDEVTQNGLFGAVCSIGLALPSAVPAMNHLAAQMMSRSSYTDTSTAILTTSRRVRFREMEYGIDVEALPDAVRQVRDLIENRGWRITFPLEVRVAAADDIPLSTAYGRATAYVAVHRYVHEPFGRYFLAVQDIMLSHGGRPHWGKLHSLDAAVLRGRYPRFADITELRREVDPKGLWRNEYLGRVLGY
ncbi:MAG: D-arabinono-1,4-lactone oxidase [Nakamurella sp.]